MSQDLSPLGPLFGPNFILISVNDETGKEFALEVFPDANNPFLRENGLPMHYYFIPQRVYLAKKQDAPKDFDFAATIFKGLETTETDIGITDAMTDAGEVSTGGGFCVFSTTFAIPESVIKNTIKALQKRNYPQPSNFNRFAHYFDVQSQGPTPELGIVPIVGNDVTVEVPRLGSVGSAAAPFFIDAQGAGKGSIEAQGISSFLVTLNLLAAGAIVGSIKNGVAPFTVHYNMRQQFYINACQIRVKVDMSKVYDSVSAALSVNYFGIASADLSYAWSQCLTSGAITTDIKMGGVDVDPQLKRMIDDQVEEMRKQVFDAVKADIFDFHPTSTPAATNSHSLVGVSVKGQHDRRTDKFEMNFNLESAIIVTDTAAGTLNDLEPAMKANVDKYLAVVDIGEFTKKIQVAATSSVNWSERLPDGTDLSDPIRSVQLEAAYPNFSDPLGPNQKPNLITRGQGFHYTPGKKDPKGGLALAAWTKDNANDVVNISWLRLAKSLPQWDADQVRLRKTVIYDGHDPRVELADGGSTVTVEQDTKVKAPVLTPDEVGYLFVRFTPDRPLRTDNIEMTLLCTIGQRTDTMVITRNNFKNAIWEVFSNKYHEARSFRYTLQVRVAGPEFTDDPVVLSTTTPVEVPLPSGRVKYISPLIVPLPPMTEEQRTVINRYMKAVQAQPGVA